MKGAGAATTKEASTVTKEILGRKALGADGAKSAQIIERENGKMISRTHEVTNKENVVLQITPVSTAANENLLMSGLPCCHEDHRCAMRIFFEPPGMVPNDLINEIRVDELANQDQARYQFVLSIDAVDASGERKEVEIRIHADSMALEDQAQPGKRITQ